MVETFIYNLYPILAALALACIGGYIAWRNNFKSRRAAACAAFRSSVLAALEGLYPVPSDWPKDTMRIDETLRTVFPRLQAAVAIFRPYLPWYRRKAFDRSWSLYRLGEEGREIDQQYYWQYIPHSGTGVVCGVTLSHDNTTTYKDNFKTNVDRLLKYATQT